MKTLFAILALALVSFASTTAQAVPVNVGQHYNFIESNYVEYVHNETLLSYEWQWWGYMVFVTHWRGNLYSHAWGIRQIVDEWWDNQTYQSWQVYLSPANYDFVSDDFIYWDEYDPPIGGDE